MLVSAKDHEPDRFLRLLVQSLDNGLTGGDRIKPSHPILRELSDSVIEREALRRPVHADEPLRRQCLQQAVDGGGT